MKKQIKIIWAIIVFGIPLLANAGIHEIEADADSPEINKEKTVDTDDDIIIKPEKALDWSVRPKLLAGVMYFKHITLEPANVSNKPVPFTGIGLSVNANNWFLNGYALDTAKTTDHLFETDKGLAKTRLSETNYNFQRQDYAITIGREITDWFTDSKRWGVSLFAGYRQGKTTLNSTSVAFNEKLPDGSMIEDALTLSRGEYIVKGPMGGIGLRLKPFEKSNSQIGLTVGYGPLKGEYTRLFTLPLTNQIFPDVPRNNTVNTWVTALNWEGELTPNLSYSLVIDYYAYSMPIQQITANPYEIKEAVASLKLFLNYRF